MKFLLIAIVVLLIILIIICVFVNDKVSAIINKVNITCDSLDKSFLQVNQNLEILSKLIQKNHAAICSNSDVIKLRLQAIMDITDVIKMNTADIIKMNNKIKQPRSSKITSKDSKQ